MLVHFRNGDKYNRNTLKTIYFDETEDMEILVDKFTQTEKIINEDNAFSISEYILEITDKDKFKSYTFTSFENEKKIFGDNRLETKFEEFFNMEFENKYTQPEFFRVKDLIGWNFINAFTHNKVVGRRFTFEKDGVIKQYKLTSPKGLRRDYNFEQDGIKYHESNGTVWGTEFKGDIYKISQALKGVVKNIVIGRDGFLIVTDKGEVRYNEVRYNAGVKLLNEPILFDCPYDNVEEEYYVVNQTLDKAYSLAHSKTRTYCLSMNPYTDRDWLRDNKVNMHFDIINKQTEQSIFSIFSIEDEYIDKGLFQKSEKIKEKIDEIIQKINKEKNFGFLEQFVYEHFPDFVEKYKNRNVPPPTKEEFEEIEKQKEIKKLELEEKKKTFILDYNRGRDIFSYGYDLMKDIPGFEKEYVYKDWVCVNVYTFTKLVNKSNLYLNDYIDCEENKSPLTLLGFRIYNKKEGYFTKVKINSIHDKEKWSEKLFKRKVSRRKRKFENTYYSLKGFLSD